MPYKMALRENKVVAKKPIIPVVLAWPLAQTLTSPEGLGSFYTKVLVLGSC